MKKRKAKTKAKAPAPSKGLRERHRLFVEAFLGPAAGNITQAARMAGYRGNDKTLCETGRGLLERDDVKAAIGERVENDPKIADRKERQEFWTRVLRGEVRTTVLDKAGNVVELSPALGERLKASALLGKSQGDFFDVHKHVVEGEVRVEHVTELPPREAEPDPGPDA